MPPKKDKDAVGKVIRFDSAYHTLTAKMNAAVTLVRRRYILFRDQLKDIDSRMKQWRKKRRTWELNLITNEYNIGNTNILKPGFSYDDIVEAEQSVDEQNALDDEDRISTWFIGRPARLKPEEVGVAQHWTRSGHCRDVIPKEMTKLKEVEETLRKQIAGETDTMDTLFIDLTHDSDTNMSIESENNGIPFANLPLH
jgi:hypothetical protein